ncbi:FAD/NAD(P)-binding domain-containing protein [Athelia psychrophila]|uniref:FAD/NAD(P)-binding domain-containing protein n=1 Tax=Athelia psychrophila TaxID=1759441 RepID=A0A166QBH9_9AGAM|nr:FAD/NAD(P)-binding domain-containing protein [Fibularhizoctonia sp. CBS 109695]
MQLMPDIRLDSDPEDRDIKRICIIGAGAAGLTALKVIMDREEYKCGKWKPVVYEAREDIGGIWLPAPPVGNPPVTPLYDSLTTNLPHPVMAFSDFLFPPSTNLFPPASTVLTYLKSYAQHFHLRSHICFNTSVETLLWNPESTMWNAKLSVDDISLDFDHVMVCNGRYRVPSYPGIPGLSTWLDQGKAIHSVYYRHPRELGKTVLVVGGGPSGNDISADLCQTSRTVIRSIKKPVTEAEENQTIIRRGKLVGLTDSGQAIFEDGSRESIDFCILATGYRMSFPFCTADDVRIGLPPPPPALPSHIYISEHHMFPLAKHIFPIQSTFPATSIVFMGLMKFTSTFPTLEAQAHQVVQVFADPDSLNLEKEALDVAGYYQELADIHGNDPRAIAKAWHVIEKTQYTYRDELWAGSRPPIVVTAWQREMQEARNILRSAWVALEKTGKAAEWVQGVGEGGVDEWVDMMKRLLKHAEHSSEIIV